VLGLRDLPDTLPGRMEAIELSPFSQGEIDGGDGDGFVDAVFGEGPDLRHPRGPAGSSGRRRGQGRRHGTRRGLRGLRHLAERLGDDFVTGIVLYTGSETLSFGPRLRAMPVSALWEVQQPG
jgi:predicted AAA+ superfamily ATPase